MIWDVLMHHGCDASFVRSLPPLYFNDSKMFSVCGLSQFNLEGYCTEIFLVWLFLFLGGGFKHFLFSPLLGEIIHFD